MVHIVGNFRQLSNNMHGINNNVKFTTKYHSNIGKCSLAVHTVFIYCCFS
jgi:hypothetical protein